MVEGPGVHRVAIAHRRVLLGRAFICTSPSGRFTEGAEVINGLYLSLIEAHGKNIFYFFTTNKMDNADFRDLPEYVIVVHIHFGMSGSFRTYEFPGPEPRETTRLRLENEAENVVAHLSAMWCVHGDMELYRKRIAELGPDPLREDADMEIAWNKMQKAKKSIGAFLMDQSMIAGIGNIYRCEILFVCGIHPNQRSSSISRSKFEDIWNQSERLLHIGVQAGSIITVSPEEAGKPFSKLKSGKRRYIYNHTKCGRCGGPVINWIIATRTCYACEACQPPIDLVVPSRKKAADTPRRSRTEGDEIEPADNDALDEGHAMEGVAKASMINRRVAKRTETSTITFRKRKVLDGKIVEHQALKEIPAGGLVDFPNNLDDVVWLSVDPKSLQEGSKLSDVVSTQSKHCEPSYQGFQDTCIDLSSKVGNKSVQGRRGRTVRSQNATDLSREEEKKMVKRRSTRTVNSQKAVSDVSRKVEKRSVKQLRDETVSSPQNVSSKLESTVVKQRRSRSLRRVVEQNK